MKITLYFIVALCSMSGIRSVLQKDKTRMECTNCISEMQGLGDLIKMGASTIEVNCTLLHIFTIFTKKNLKDFLVENYCPTVAPDPSSHIQCERDLAGNYVPLLEMVVDHYFVEGAEHICKAWGVCPVLYSPSMNEYTEILFPSIYNTSLLIRYTCQECIEGLEWVEAYMNDPLWVAEYTLYLEENFCPTQTETNRLGYIFRFMSI